jgi:uncharacterized membrane protein
MSSKTKLPGHTLHPMLIGFPILFYISTFASLCIYFFTGTRTWFTISYFANIAAVATAILAALPGFIDWLNIPSVKKTKFAGLQQIGLNSIAMILLCINLYIQNETIYNDTPPAQPGITLTAIATVLILTAAFSSHRLHVFNSSFRFQNQKQQQLETSNHTS